MTRGWFNMVCWNGLSADQQRKLVLIGTLEIGYQPDGECENPAEVAVETRVDQAPGPRFYCLDCARAYLNRMGAVSEHI